MTHPKQLLLLISLGAIGSAQPLPPACIFPGPEPCLYQSNINQPVGVTDLLLVDGARSNYPVPIRVRYPVMPGRHPVVLWNHGGSPSPNGRERSEEWGMALAAAGYVVIHPSRMPILNATPFLPECALNGMTDPAVCAEWIAQSRYGPQTTHFLIDRLAVIDAAIPARLDRDRIVVAGHSAGTIMVLANAGATQQWVMGGPVYNEVDSRPMAFFGTGPQGPMYAAFLVAGFPEGENYKPIDRPFGFVSGHGDRNGNDPASRTAGWLFAMQGHKYLSWDTSSEAHHGTMNIHDCTGLVRANHCRWIEAFGLAFFDALVRQRPQAIAWLADPDAYSVLTGGAIESHRR